MSRGVASIEFCAVLILAIIISIWFHQLVNIYAFLYLETYAIYMTKNRDSLWQKSELNGMERVSKISEKV